MSAWYLVLKYKPARIRVACINYYTFIQITCAHRLITLLLLFTRDFTDRFQAKRFEEKAKSDVHW